MKKLTQLTRPNPLWTVLSTMCLSSKGHYPYARYMGVADRNPCHVEIINRNLAIRAWKQGWRIPANVITCSYE